jgi:hypothetical protein
VRDTVNGCLAEARLKTDAGCCAAPQAGVGVLRCSASRPPCIEVVNRGECAEGVMPFRNCGRRGDPDPGVAGLRIVLETGVPVSCAVERFYKISVRDRP